MKKILSCLLACILTLGTGIFLGGCKKDVTIKSMKVKSGLEYEVAQNSDFSTADIVVTVTYSDKSKKDVKASELSFSNVDTTTVGEKELKITYKNFTITVTITVVEVIEQKTYQILSLQSNLYNEYQTFSSGQDSHFKFKNEPLTAGTDNTFNFRISAQGTEEGTNHRVPLTRDLVPLNVVVEKRTEPYTDGDWVWETLTADQISSYMTITEGTDDIKFKNNDDTKGHFFRFTFSAKNPAVGYEDQTKFTAIVKVEEGFNIFSTQDLAMFDTREYHEATRALVKAKYGLASSYVPKRLLLQTSINLEISDFPDYFVYQEDDTWVQQAEAKQGIDIAGTPINYYATMSNDTKERLGGIYHRDVEIGSEFSFNGNYFMINIQDIPQMVVKNDNGNVRPDYTVDSNFCKGNNNITSFQSLFFIGKGNNITAETSAYVKNINFRGNAEVSSDPKYSGGLIMLKDRAINFTAYNTVANYFYITYFFENGARNNKFDGEFLIDNCYARYSFQSLLYMNQCEHLLIKDCDFREAGGPAIIADHDKGATKDTKGDEAPGIDIVNSTIESYINANSPWFAMYDLSSLVTTLMTSGESLFTNSALPDCQKTIVKREHISDQDVSFVNCVAVLNNNGVPKEDGKRIFGYIRVFNNMDEYNEFYPNQDAENFDYRTAGANSTIKGLDMWAKQYDAENGYIDHAINNNANVFEGNLGGYIVSNDPLNKNSLTAGATAVYTMSTVLAQMFQQNPSSSLQFNAELRAKLLNIEYINDIKNRLSQLAQQNTQYLNTFYQLGLTGTSQPQQIPKFMKEIYGWETMNDTQKVEAIERQLKSYFYAYSDYLNCYLFNGIGALLQLVPKQ